MFHLDPRTKVFMTITISTIFISSSSTGVMAYVRIVLGILPFLLLLVAKRYSGFLKSGALFVGALFLEMLTIGKLHGEIGFAILAFVGITTRMLPGMIMGYVTIVTTEVGEFIEAMRRMHFPDAITIPLSVLFRFSHSLKEEYGMIRDAMVMRGLTFFKVFQKPMLILEYRLVPLLMCSVLIAEDLSIASLTRGLKVGGQRSSLRVVRLTWFDCLVFLLMLAGWTLFFINL